MRVCELQIIPRIREHIEGDPHPPGEEGGQRDKHEAARCKGELSRASREASSEMEIPQQTTGIKSCTSHDPECRGSWPMLQHR